MSDTQAPLQLAFERICRAEPGRTCVQELDGTRLTYGELDALAKALARLLLARGVVPGDRVGICLPKTIDSVTALLAVLKAGAAYVPVDVSAPPARSAFIFADCAVRAVIAEAGAAESLGPELSALGHVPAWIVLGDPGGGRAVQAVLSRETGDWASTRLPAPAEYPPLGLAYILYTSGSTGKPKGVMLTHENATSFVSWAIDQFRPTPADRFSSHAPFHFDLSILDIYVPLSTGASLVLIGEEAGKEPLGLAGHIAQQKLTVWYSTPSILSLLAQYGRLERHDLSALRIVLFAGEVFPVRHLRTLKSLLPAPRYFNLYGPTETNVCTWHEIPASISEDRSTPFPIGEVCRHLRGRVVDPEGRDVPPGEEGELVISGPGVTVGYWNLPERNALAYLRDGDGTAWYKTGDIVVDDGSGCFTFVGRRDRMVKRRGYRVELGEIEVGLYRHPAVHEAAVVALADADGGVRLRAFLACNPGQRPSIIDLKIFCARELPAYMTPDVFTILPELPHTSTDKIDYQKLKEWP